MWVLSKKRGVLYMLRSIVVLACLIQAASANAACTKPSGTYVGGGGGGAGAAGGDAGSWIAGNGGNGVAYKIMGVTKTYSGGGGGSLRGSGTSSGGRGGGGGGNGNGTGANATYYGGGGGAGGGNGTACMGGDGFQGIVLVEVNTDPYPAPILQNPGNQNFIAGGSFYINQLVTGIPDITWTLTQVYSTPVLTNPGSQTFTNGGTFTVTQTVNQYLVGSLTWSITPTTGVSLFSSSSTSATFTVSPYPGLAAVSYIVTATNSQGVSGSTTSFTITNTTTYLYNFTSFTFTPMGATGTTGPTAITYGTSTPGYGTASVMTLSGGIQYWTVPKTGNYSFTLAGAQGGTGTVAAGYGAVVTTTLSLTSGNILKLLVGQTGLSATSGCGIKRGGGGGGSFVYNNNTSTILAVAGGGGGGRAITTATNGNGGLYGGGASAQVGATGAQGIIVFTYNTAANNSNFFQFFIRVLN